MSCDLCHERFEGVLRHFWVEIEGCIFLLIMKRKLADVIFALSDAQVFSDSFATLGTHLENWHFLLSVGDDPQSRKLV